jgi:hypothetical protein
MANMLEEDLDSVTLFNYMIGNADHPISGSHNVKLIVHNETGVQGFIPVPYDFDYSGLVNASYAVPGDNLGIESVRERYYLGLCRDSDDFKETLDLFEEKKEGILSFVDNFPYLDTREKSEPRSYLHEFYRMAAKSGSLYRITLSTCRQKQ